MELTRHLDDNQTYRLEVCTHASLAPTSFADDNGVNTLQKELIKMDSRYDPQTGRCREERVSEMREMAEAVFRGTLDPWALWDLRERRRHENIA